MDIEYIIILIEDKDLNRFDWLVRGVRSTHFTS